MNCTLRALLFPGIAVATFWFASLASTASAETVWSGLTKTFTRADSGLPTDPANQDRITDNVWLTRDSTAGIFNIVVESAYDQFNYYSPIGTSWATALNSPGETIAASNWENLTFTAWRGAYQGGGMALPFNLLNYNAVVRLDADDIYLDLQFTDWQTLGSGAGAFAYIRAVPEPVSWGMAALGLLLLSAFARRR
jgi:hypothetical protein